MIAYRIRDWARHFENNRTREMRHMAWVPVPNKHDGEGYQSIMTQPDGIAIYGCWHLILQVASKCLRERGTLLRDDGTPLTAESLALKTGWRNPKDFQRALDFCSSPQVAWIEAFETEPAEIPQEGAAGVRNPSVLFHSVLSGSGPDGGSGGKMPEDGWTLEQILSAASNPTVAVTRERAQEYFDCRTAAGWIDATGRKVAQTMPALMADLRKWKRFEPHKAPEAAGGAAGGPSEEWKRARDACADAVWTAKETGEDVRRAMVAARDKWRDVPKWRDQDAVTKGFDLALNNKRSVK